MHPTGSRKCLHCADFFLPDAHNRERQRYCVKPGCRQASRAASQAKWLAKPENLDHWKGPENVQRVQEWRKANPGYSRRRGPRRRVALQDIPTTQPVVPQPKAEPVAEVALPNPCVPLQDSWESQNPVLVGLIAQFAGVTLQEDLEPMLRHLHSRGRVILGIDVRPPDYAKTTDRSRTTPAHAGPV